MELAHAVPQLAAPLTFRGEAFPFHPSTQGCAGPGWREARASAWGSPWRPHHSSGPLPKGGACTSLREANGHPWSACRISEIGGHAVYRRGHQNWNLFILWGYSSKAPHSGGLEATETCSGGQRPESQVSGGPAVSQGSGGVLPASPSSRWWRPSLGFLGL